MIATVIILFQLAGFISAIHAIMSTRTEQGAVAWGVSLVAFPYVAVPAYWVLGRSRFEGYVTARQGEMDEIAGISAAALAAVREYQLPAENVTPSARAAERLAGMPFLRGNSLELLIDGDATFDNILAGIDAAQDYVLFQFFIVHDDDIGRKVKEHLIARARAGVRVYFLFDEVGSHKLPSSYKQELEEAGGRGECFQRHQGPG